MQASAPAERPIPGSAARYIVESATPADDAALRDLLRSTSMEGQVRLSLQREPDFFLGAGLGNLATEVIVSRERSTGALVSTGTRATRRAFVDGEERPVGYLSGLRLQERVRKGGLLAQGYRYLRGRQPDGVPYSVTTILDGNEEAKRILTSGRAGLPTYVPYGRLRTYLLPLYGFRKCPRPVAVIRGATSETLPDAIERVNRCNAAFQFAPAYRAEELDPSSGMLRGLSADNVYLRVEGSAVVGTLAVWNQHGFKQSVVTGYSRGLAAARPVLNLAARFGLAARLPRAGQSMPCLYAALVGCRLLDDAVFQELLDAALSDWTNRGYAYLLLGLCDGHPFSRIVQQRAAMEIGSTVYLVYWPEAKPELLPSTSRVPHLEVATL